MDLKGFVALLAACLAGVCAAADQQDVRSAGLNSQPSVAPHVYVYGERALSDPFDDNTFSGNYLASQFAQRHHDWRNAEKFLNRALVGAPSDVQLLKRSMLLSMGSGEVKNALEIAQDVLKQESPSGLASLFLTIGAVHDGDFNRVREHANTMPDDSLSDFVVPVILGWADAAEGKNTTAELNKNTIHIYHTIMIADYLGDYSVVEAMLEKALAINDKAPEDYEEIAGIYTHIGQKDKALEIYKKLKTESPALAASLDEREKLIAEGKNLTLFDKVKTPQQGVAEALYDMARLLYREQSDDSARVFAQMSLYLSPGLTKSHFLLAEISAKNEQLGQAIESYRKVGKDDPYFIEAQRRAAELLEDDQRLDEAVAQLRALADHSGDVESLIRIGDIYRRNQEFGQAIGIYNEAAAKIGDTIPADYWHLLYARGMSYEQAGQWDKAEADLKAALSYQPEHPYILNYLGYAWADQGINLSEALDFIKRAVALEPGDGYITDSLGWVYYKMGHYAEAVPHLEQAVELLPYDSTINDHLGDAYWQVGRKMEAKFQWRRARNFSEDAALIASTEEKIAQGLPAKVDLVKEATSTQALPQEEAILSP